MPEISRFLGMVIAMLYRDHAPPHFHVNYGGHEASISIDPPGLLSGKLLPRVLALVIEWAAIHQNELLDDWARARAMQPLLPVAPLE